MSLGHPPLRRLLSLRTSAKRSLKTPTTRTDRRRRARLRPTCRSCSAVSNLIGMRHASRRSLSRKLAGGRCPSADLFSTCRERNTAAVRQSRRGLWREAARTSRPRAWYQLGSFGKTAALVQYGFAAAETVHLHPQRLGFFHHVVKLAGCHLDLVCFQRCHDCRELREKFTSASVDKMPPRRSLRAMNTLLSAAVAVACSSLSLVATSLPSMPTEAAPLMALEISSSVKFLPVRICAAGVSPRNRGNRHSIAGGLHVGAPPPSLQLSSPVGWPWPTPYTGFSRAGSQPREAAHRRRLLPPNALSFPARGKPAVSKTARARTHPGRPNNDRHLDAH